MMVRARDHHGAGGNSDREESTAKDRVNPGCPDALIAGDGTIHCRPTTGQHLKDGATFVYSVHNRTISQVSLENNDLDRIDKKRPDSNQNSENDQQAAQVIHSEFEAIKLIA